MQEAYLLESGVTGQSSVGDRFHYSPDMSAYICIDIIMRNEMLITLED